jgi:hypothetical protein
MNPHLFGALLNSAANVSAIYMELQMNWLTMTAPRTNQGSEFLSHGAAAGGRARATDEELARSMDIVLGAEVASPV